MATLFTTDFCFTADANAAGMVILPAQLVASVTTAQVEVRVQPLDQSESLPAMVTQAEHPLILGIRLADTIPPPHALELRFEPFDAPNAAVVFTGIFER